MPRIAGFHRDDEGHWVADLDCGHSRHVRHDPPFVERPWVMTEAGRKAFLGTDMPCAECPETAIPAESDRTRAAILRAMEEAGIAGLCREGQIELAVEALKPLHPDLSAEELQELVELVASEAN
ncbi:MAG: DUF3565 domain-containing protein [Alphaproteobacteria bacterium]